MVPFVCLNDKKLVGIRGFFDLPLRVVKHFLTFPGRSRPLSKHPTAPYTKEFIQTAAVHLGNWMRREGCSYKICQTLFNNKGRAVFQVSSIKPLRNREFQYYLKRSSA